MLSRVADALFWMNAYIERAENIARYIHVNMHLMLDLFLDKAEGQWKPLIITSGDEEQFLKKHSEYTEENVIHFLTFDETNPNSILSCIHSARDNAKSIKEIISSEMWEQLNNFYLLVKSNSRKRNIENLHGFFKSVKMESHLFSGLTDATMLHNEGMYYSQLGRMLERADKTARIVDVKYFMLLPKAEFSDSPYDIIQWGALLKSISAFEMYRKKYRKITSRNIVKFLIFDEVFPRSIYYCINSASICLNQLEDSFKGAKEAQEKLHVISNYLTKFNVDEVIEGGLHEFIDTIQLNLVYLGESIQNSLFSLDETATPVKSVDLQNIYQ
tara:strand:+ start:12116 stop:13102 length:987 start_codon:yes stop_codon:yes gene_type:complete